jgi:hypothetical protein
MSVQVCQLAAREEAPGQPNRFAVASLELCFGLDFYLLSVCRSILINSRNT